MYALFRAILLTSSSRSETTSIKYSFQSRSAPGVDELDVAWSCQPLQVSQELRMSKHPRYGSIGVPRRPDQITRAVT